MSTTLDLQSLKDFLLSIDGADGALWADRDPQYNTLLDLVGTGDTLFKITCDGKVFFVEYDDGGEHCYPCYHITPEHNIPSYTL